MPSRTPPLRRPTAAVNRLSLVWRVFILNALVFALAAAALALSPATVSFPILLTEALVLIAGLVAILLLNLLLVRRSLAPLDQLMTLMRRADLLRTGERLAAGGPREVRELGSVFNEMIERLERERRESGRAALTSHEDERRLVARELHDELGQSMTAVMLMLSRLVDRAPDELQPELLEAREAARGSLDDVRRITRRLRPEALDDLGLAAALTALAADFGERTGLPLSRHIAGDLPPLSPEAELAVFRVAQESLTNVARHSGATRIELRLEPGEGHVRLSVRDNGCGLGGAGFGSGIRGMRERALLVGGSLELHSPRSGGVDVRLTIPAGA